MPFLYVFFGLSSLIILPINFWQHSDLFKLVRQRSYWRRSREYVQRRVCFVNIQSSLHENVLFSVVVVNVVVVVLIVVAIHKGLVVVDKSLSGTH